MRTLSLALLANTVVSKRKALKLSQAQLAQAAGINRSILSNLENGLYTPSIGQLEALAAALNFDPTEVFIEQSGEPASLDRRYRIAVAGAGYVGLKSSAEIYGLAEIDAALYQRLGKGNKRFLGLVLF